MTPIVESRRHDEARLALPWLANGTLAGAEAAAVEAHVAVCPDCREELAAERRLIDEMRAGGEVAPAPHPVQLARLWERIEASEKDTRPAAAPTVRNSEVLVRWPRGARWLAGAQAAAIVLLLVFVAGAPRPRGATFRTLASAPAPAHAARLRVVFADTLDQRALRELLLPLGAEIVAGPSPLGVFTLALPAGAEPLDWVVAHLRARPEVRFAEPVRAEPAP